MATLLQKLLGASNQIAKRGSTAVKEVGPEVIGKGPGKIIKEAADEIPEAAFKEITPTTGMDDMSWINRMDPRLKAFAKGGAAGAGAGYIANELYPPGEDPIKEEEPLKAIEPKKPDEIAHDAKATVKTEAPKPDGLDSAALTEEEKDDPKSQPVSDHDVDFNKILEQGISDKKDALRDASLLRASERLGAGFARINANHGSSDILRQEAGQSLEDAKNRISTHREQMAFQKAKDEMKDEAKMSDPNSEISKLVTSLAIKTGLIKQGQSVSAATLKSAGVNLGTLLTTIEAGNARRDAAALSRDTQTATRKSNNDFKAEQEQIKRDDKRKLITEEVEDRKRNIMENLTTAKQMVKSKGTVELFGSHNENLNRVIDAIAVDMAKLADPKSVARPSEVEMFKKGLFEAGLSEGNKLSNASALDIMDKFEKEVERRSNNAYKVRGIPQDNVPTPGTNIPSKDNNSGRQLVSKQYSPSRDKTRMVYSDGTEEVVDGKQ